MNILKNIIFFLSILNFRIDAQNQTSKWYFGYDAGLDFSTSPPTVLTNGVMSANAGCGSIADASGNLLFYTNGITVWNSSHSVMSNGSFLSGGSNATESGLIVKQPGSSSNYYIFTLAQLGGSSGLSYSIVDISLSSGSGSVTTKNIVLQTPSTEKVAAARHCNGSDIWIISHDNISNNFRTFLLTSVGISTLIVNSAVGSTITTSGEVAGNLKVAPNSKMIGLAISTPSSSFELYDFDNSTGIISNYQNIGDVNYAYGCEFSPDGTKFYGADYVSSSTLYQWDLCAGSGTAIAASKTTIASVTTAITSMQLAIDGKIYLSKNNESVLGVISTPNLAGSSCNYIDQGQSVSPNSCGAGLPGFVAGSFLPQFVPLPFTYSISNSSCNTILFTSPPAPSTTLIGCSVLGYSLISGVWNFGDPLSGSTNTSTSINPSHQYSNPGTYTAQLINYYSCGGANDTTRQIIIIPSPTLVIPTTSITCANLGSATITISGGIGPFSYTWNPTSQTSSVATGLIPGTYSITAKDLSGNCIYNSTVNFSPLIPLTGSLVNTTSLTCNGVNSGTATFVGLSGGSGSEYYFWNSSVGSQTNAFATTLGAYVYSVTVTDALTACTIYSVFTITQPPALSLTIIASSATACVGSSVNLSGIASGGTPGFTYLWNDGTITNTLLVSENTASNFIYTLNARDSYSCLVSHSIAINFITNPVLSVNSVSICPFETATLTASGASSYTWNNSFTSSTFTASPPSTMSYTLIGSAAGCTTSINPSIILKPVPFPIIVSNSPVCEGNSLNLYGYGGLSYSWSGPNNFNSSNQFPSINTTSLTNSGVYQLTVTASNGCTATANSSVLIVPIPTLSALGTSVCAGQTIGLSVSTLTGSSFYWTGPNSFTSSLQAPVINTASVINSGNYTTVVTNSGCSNTAAVNVSVAPIPNILVSSNSPICQASVLTLNSNGGTNYSWSGPNSFLSSSQNPTITNITIASTGIYSLVATTGPCAVTKTLSIIVNSLPNPNISSNSPVCEGFNLKFNSTASNIISYNWYGPAFFSSQPTPSIINVSSLNSGVYTLSVTDANSCISTTTLTVNVLQNPTVSATGATVCLGEPAQLSVNGANTYFWQGPGLFQSSGSNPVVPAATNSITGFYTVVGTSTNLCTDTSYTTIKILSLPSASISLFPGPQVCRNASLSLEGFGGSVYEWTGQNNFYYLGKLLTFNPGFIWPGGTYTLTITDSRGCKNKVSTSFTINELPEGSLEASISQGCIPFCSDFNFSSQSPTSNQIVTSWKLENNLYKGKNFKHCFNNAGTFIIKGTLLDTLTGCANTPTFSIDAYPKPTANFTSEPEIPIENMEAVFKSTSTGDNLKNYSWLFKNDNSTKSNYENTAFTFDEAGMYPLAFIVKNSWGCSDSITKLIKVDEDFTVYIPNVFTPNEDSKNELFLPIIRGLKFYHLLIYNRKGMKLFESTDINSGWDGKFKGEPCMTDVYVWKVELSSKSGEQKVITGYVTLYR